MKKNQDEKEIRWQVWLLAWPIIIANVSTPLLGLVDTAVMGYMDSANYLAAVSLGAVVFSFIFWGFGFLRMGTTGFVSQFYGAKDYYGMGQFLSRVVILALFISAIVALLYPAIKWLVIHFVDAEVEVEIMTSAYMDLRIYSIPATLFNYIVIGTLIGLQKSRSVMWLVVLMNLCNIVLDLLLVVIVGWGVEGVAIASVIAEYVTLIVGLWIIHRHLKSNAVRLQVEGLFQWGSYKTLLRTNSHIFIRTLLLMAVFSFFTLQGAKYGAVVMAANAILMNFQTMMAYILDGFSHAMEAMVGEALGKNDLDRLRVIVNSGLLYALMVALLFVVVYFLLGSWVIASLTTVEAVVAAATIYLLWLVVSPLVSFCAFIMDGVFIGAGLTREMRNAMLFSTLCFVIAWYVGLAYENHGLWGALIFFMAVRSLAMGFLFVNRLGGKKIFIR